LKCATDVETPIVIEVNDEAMSRVAERSVEPRRCWPPFLDGFERIQSSL